MINITNRPILYRIHGSLALNHQYKVNGTGVAIIKYIAFSGEGRCSTKPKCKKATKETKTIACHAPRAATNICSGADFENATVTNPINMINNEKVKVYDTIVSMMLVSLVNDFQHISSSTEAHNYQS